MLNVDAGIYICKQTMHARLLVIYLGILSGYISEVLHIASGKGLSQLHICLQDISNAARGLGCIGMK